MSRQISRAENWERVYEAFQQVNFAAFDFNTIKESLLDYIKLYFPEDFNDYIESSEFIATLEMFAYMGELIAYRVDLNAHENFITQAQRKESILRLVKLISYDPSRNLPARGLVKITSISTTETVLDSAGRDLTNRQIIWDDNNNSDWKEQFLLVMNRVLEQEFGTVAPSERIQVDDVLFELYSWNNNPIATSGKSVFPYTVSVVGEQLPMELVPVSLTDTGPEEKRPEIDAKFTLLYGSDGLGDGSDTTGFFMFTKQGNLNRLDLTFDGVTPNLFHDINITNINDTDLWLNNVDNGGEILVNNPYEDTLPHYSTGDLRYGEWIEVDLAHAQNIIFNTNKNRHKFEVESLDDDQLRLIFGDGEFSEIPKGHFHVWYRTSNNTDTPIPRSSVTNNSAAFSYTDVAGSVQTLTFSYAYVNSLQNGAASEDIEHIRQAAPSVYYTQDRMVNGRDYNTYMLQDQSILKMRAVNRTFAGDSKYMAWHEPRENYENVKLFGDDMAMYWDERDPTKGGLTEINHILDANNIIEDYIEPLLCSADFFMVIAPRMEALNINPGNIRCTFSTAAYSFDSEDNEILAISDALNNATTTSPIDLYYSVEYDEWTVGAAVGHPCDLETANPPDTPTIGGCVNGPGNSIWMIRIELKNNLTGWDIRWRTRRMVTYSEDTRFWNTNDDASVLNYDTLESNKDTIVILQANKNGDNNGLLLKNYNYTVLAQELVEQNLPSAGLPDIHKLSVIHEDTNNDTVPDNLLQPDLFDLNYSQDYQFYLDHGLVDTDADPDEFILPDGRSFLTEDVDNDIEVWVDDVRIYYSNGTGLLGLAPTEDATQEIIRYRFTIDASITLLTTTIITILVKDYVYFHRDSATDPWLPQPTTPSIMTLYALDDTPISDDVRYKRHEGRFPLNFAWFHHTPRFHLVDPTPTNIIDSYIVTRGYYLSLTRWLGNRTDIEPSAPTPLDLRTTYGSLLDNKMISDSVILQSGIFKILFGTRANAALRAKFKVIRPTQGDLTDNEVKVRIVNVIKDFFQIEDWEFGETYYFTEMAASIHAALGPEIDSIVLVPTYAQNQFGDMFQVPSREHELFVPDINTTDIEIVQAYTPDNIKQNES